MAMESDCVSLQTSLTSSDTTDSSLLATPELTPPSSTSSHDGSETSFFSALSSNNSDTLKPDVGLEHASLVDSRISEMGLPERVQFPLAKLASLNPRKPPPLPLHGPVILHCSPDLRRPRKLRKSRPPVPRLSIDSAFSCVSGPLQSASSPTPLNHHQKTPLTSPIIPCRPSTPEGNLMRRNRRSSLPTIPSATFYSTSKWNGDEPDEGYVNSRMVRFQSPVGSKRKQTPGPRSPRSPHPKALTRNASTHALVSLAWTGQVPSSIGSSGLSSIGSSFALPTPGGRSASLKSARRSTWSLVEEDDDLFENSLISSRPRIHRQCSSPIGRTRRWTLAMAITNDEISDEMFMEELERMRAKGRFWETRRSLDSPSSPQSPVASFANSSIDPPLPSPLKHGLPCLSDPLLSATWQTARRALLICRELIRTERHYLSSLFVLASNGTATPAPALMLTYLPALVQASEDLLVRMESNPSAQGVAEAFLLGESRLESAFVAWCGVVGGFFVGADDQAMTRDRAASTSMLPETDSPITIPLKRRVTTWVQGKRNSSVKSRAISAMQKQPLVRGRLLPTVRDLAILPTQRVMRYALLFKDLLAHTPSSSPSHIVVERALGAAIVIAQKSDRAQGNAAFLHQPA